MRNYAEKKMNGIAFGLIKYSLISICVKKKQKKHIKTL